MIQTTIQITPSVADASAILRTNQMLTALIAYFGEDTNLINPQTGEVIEMSELPRVLGILSAFLESNNWEIRKG
jgi:hypothetical protein